MCMSMSPAVFSKTRLVTWFTPRSLTGLIYQNQMQNASPGPNAMVFTIPMRPTEENLKLVERNTINTESFPSIAENIVETEVFSLSKSMPMAFAALDRDGQEFETRAYECGGLFYVMGDRRGINKRLATLPPEKRVQLSDTYVEGVKATGRGDWAMVVVCFDGNKVVKAPPVMFSYPQDIMTGQLVFPALDDHTGKGPNLDLVVETDHALATSADHLPEDVRLELAGRVRYESWLDMPEGVRAILPRYALTCTFERPLPNGDWVLDTQDPVFQTGHEDGRLAYDLMRRTLMRIGQIENGPFAC